MRQLIIYNDSELIASLRTSDQNAFEAIYRKYGSILYGFAYKSISTKEDCEEIIQDVFESLWKRRESLPQDVSLNAYLFKMVKFKVIDYIRLSLVKKKYAEHYMLFEEVYDTVNDELTDKSEILSSIEKSISKLPERCRIAFCLRYYERLSYKEIAFRMNINIKTVENHIGTALSYLRKANRHLVQVKS
jgi:RNA polymerase sigma-70 factor (family 1)